MSLRTFKSDHAYKDPPRVYQTWQNQFPCKGGARWYNLNLSPSFWMDRVCQAVFLFHLSPCSSFYHLYPHVMPQNSLSDLLEVNQIMVVSCLNLLVPFYFTFEKSEFLRCTVLMILFPLSLKTSFPVPWSPACLHSTSSWDLSHSFLLCSPACYTLSSASS